MDASVWSQEDTEDIRPYAVTGGRTEPRHAMRLVSLLRATGEQAPEHLGPKAEEAFALCRGEARSVAEIAAEIAQPVQVTKIILSDLIDTGAVVLALPVSTPRPDDPQFLESLLAGLRHKFHADLDAA